MKSWAVFIEGMEDATDGALLGRSLSRKSSSEGSKGLNDVGPAVKSWTVFIEGMEDEADGTLLG